MEWLKDKEIVSALIILIIAIALIIEGIIETYFKQKNKQDEKDN